ncbi:hypothetical protein HEMROJRC1_20670 [Rodentibacter sp. JRC1]|uniref:TraK domain-containing protein n=1 Tax=Rodentibacter sp. JRC1 TaxID=2874504 RepID=UPI001CFCD71A|nr:type-F conjugative transfer system secretin TraK [Rodentibacter sp. JRC1]GJI56955.1 hypothetical protein HEMROJRC1_20670 [Rodentibacter sp. JRC1]
MKNKYFILSLFAFSVSQSSYAIDVSLKPFEAINATVSSKEPNVINVKNDTISAISAKNGAVLKYDGTTDGSVIFSTSETKPFSILIETEKGFTFTVNATPKKSNSAAIVIHNLAEKGNALESDSMLLNSSENTYSGLITQILTELINHREPKGFVETRNRKFDVSPTLKGILTIRNTDAWVGQDIRVVKLDITNISMNTIELNERILWNKGVMAIGFDPAATTLPPNRRVFAYVVLKEVE